MILNKLFNNALNQDPRFFKNNYNLFFIKFLIIKKGILKELEVSKLQGRGGAGFSTYEKWKAAKKSKAEP